MIAHISVAVDMRTLLDRNNFSSRTNGQVAARRMTAYYQKAACITDLYTSVACMHTAGCTLAIMVPPSGIITIK